MMKPFLSLLLNPYLISFVTPLITSLILLSPAHALEKDKESLIEIQSDSAEFNEAKGTALYQGDVELRQGTLLIQSEALTIYNSEKGVSKVLAEGTPAHYQQLVDTDKPPVKAKANRIIYFPQNERIALEGSARLQQGENIFEGEHIHYDLQKHILNAKGRLKNETGKEGHSTTSGRVKMVIPPTRQ